jgi:aryl-phospho-beta-D-glucosidase BglC (GH1 family)
MRLKQKQWLCRHRRRIVNIGFSPKIVCGLLISVTGTIACTGSSAATVTKTSNYPQQAISSFSPTSGAAGTVVTLKGSGFTGSNSAWAGNAHDAGLTVVSDTQARVIIPADASTGAIAVLNPVHAVFTPGSFTVTTTSTASPPQQLIQSFSPSTGIVGTVILLTGSGFMGSNAAWIGTAHDAALKVLSDTQAQLTVPADGVSGQLAIFNTVHAAFSGSAFTVSGTAPTAAQPTISSFSPTSGSVGSVITVAGSGFSGANSAWIGSARDASLTVTSDTQAKVNVPSDATTGPITILNSQHSSTSGASFTVVATAPAPAPAPTPAAGLSLRVQGSHFIDSKGNVLQLRGASYSGYESVAIQGWDAADPSGAQAGQAAGPKWSALQSWKANVVRFPLNEASWLGYSCTDTSGVVHNPDPGGNYKSFVQTQVSQAVAAGLYVIIDLHWTAPGTTCPMLQSQMADADHSLTFWTSVANTFKSNQAVAFELFNEPFLNFDFSGDGWAYMMKGVGGPFTGFPATSGSGAWKDVKQSWNIASYQQMITTVRATGATNVVMVGSMTYSQDMSGWLANKPSDPLNQMAAVWHAYPTFGTTWGTAAYAQPNFSPAIYTNLQAILAAGIPIVATETGDRNSVGTQGAPLVANVTAWADQYGISVLGWGWDVWGNTDNVLIKDVNGTPTDGYGQVFKQWMLAH